MSNVLSSLIQGIASGEVRIVDLTRTLDPNTPVLMLPPEFGESWPFSMEEISRYDERGPAWYWNNIKCGEHTGTHFDAPIHWVTGKDHSNHATDTIPVDKFIAPAVVVDAVDEARANPDFLLTREFLLKWEEKHGKIPEGAWFLYRTDWSKKTDNDEYLNMSEDGAHSPGWDPDALKFLIEERNVIGAGVETVGTDAGQAPTQDPMFPCHNMMHGSNRFGLASLCNLDQLPATGAVLITPPLKIKEGSGSPLRVLAMV
jgi:kynurenine formamidase